VQGVSYLFCHRENTTIFSGGGLSTKKSINRPIFIEGGVGGRIPDSPSLEEGGEKGKIERGRGFLSRGGGGKLLIFYLLP